MTWPSRPGGPAEDDDPTGVRALLAALPDPGPMPDDVAARVLARLADARDDAVSRGGTAAGATGERADASEATDGHEMSGIEEEVELAAVLPFATLEVAEPRSPRGSRPPRWLIVAGAAAAVGVVLVGATAVYRGLATSSSLSASVQQRDSASGAAAPMLGGPGQTVNGHVVHVQMSGRAYTEAALTRQAQEILESPTAEVVLPVADAAKIGPIATPDGLTSCITTLGEGDADEVAVDMATYAGQSAAVIVVVTAAAKQVFAVLPTCSQGDPQILVGPLPMT